MSLNKLIILVSKLIGSLISTAKFTCPFLIFNCHASILVKGFRLLKALITFTLSFSKLIESVIVVRSKVLAELEALSGASENVMELTIRVQTANDLVLRWHVKLFHHAIQFLAQFYILLIEFGNLTIFLGKQEFQIFYLVLSLAALSLPFEVGTVSMLTVLNQLEVKIIVFFNKSLIFLLKRRHRLSVKSGFVGDDCILILELLEGLSGLQHLIQKSLNQG